MEPNLKRKREEEPTEKKKRKIINLNEESVLEKEKIYCIELTSGETGKKLGTFEISCETTSYQLNELVNKLEDFDNKQFFTFHCENVEVLSNLKNSALENATETRKSTSTKDAPLKVVFFKQALFKVRPVTRCTDTLRGHTESILCLEFSSDGKRLVTGGGDKTLRLWDLTTATPIQTLKGHDNHVLQVKWSPDSKFIASGDRSGVVKIWNGLTGKKISKNLRNHKKWITGISWEPFIVNIKCNRFVTSSKDCTINVWNATFARLEFTLSGHVKGVSSVCWCGDGLIYSASQDSTVGIWNPTSKSKIKELRGHSHWINTIAFSTDYVLRRGPYDEHCNEVKKEDYKKAQEKAIERYKKCISSGIKMITGSDDNTLILWKPKEKDEPIKRMTGHLQIVNDVKFSPDGKYIASASFDKRIFIWDANTGKVITRLKGHVGSVYKLAWSGDSRLLASCSKDSTCKIWNIQFSKLLYDLPGHHDEVYAVDWSPDGQRVASAGKDRTLKIWKN